jgi:hypothetical protein
MKRTAPAYQALGGLSLALVCSPLGEHLSKWSQASTNPVATHAETTAAGPAGPSEHASVRKPATRAEEESLLTSDGLFAGSDHVPSVAVSAEGLGDHAAESGGGIRVALAGSSHSSGATSAAADGPDSFAPSFPALPPAPGGTPEIEPAVTALFEPTSVEPIVTAGAPDAETLPDAVVPHAGSRPAHPYEPQAAPEGPASSTPFKRGGGHTPDKPEGRADAPLPGNGPVSSTPPADGPRTPNPSPTEFPGHSPNPGPTPGGPNDWLPPVNPPGPLTWPQDPLVPLLPDPPDDIANLPLGPDDPLDAGLPNDLVVVAAVPEPSGLALLAIAALGLAGIGRTRRSS